MDKLIINLCPTGMVPGKAQTPHVPESSEEIIEQVQACYEIGITIVHLHARDEQGLPTYKKSIYRKTIEGIRKHCPNLVICTSLSGRNISEFEKRSEPLELYPDMASLTLSSLNFVNQASVNTPEVIRQLALKIREYGVKPELEVFDLGMMNYAKYLISKELLTPPFYFNIILGNIASAQMNLSHLGALLADLPPDSYWSLGGIGDYQLRANATAIANGGGVRVGLEDTIYFNRNTNQLATNAALVQRVHQLAEIAGRPIMSGKEFGSLGFYNSKTKGDNGNS